MLTRVLGAIVALLALEAIVFAVLVGLGVYDVAATSPHTAFGRWLLDAVQRRSVAVRAGHPASPSLDDPSLVLLGASVYGEMCVVCHGAPGVDRGEIGRGLTPRPPDLARAAHEWSDAQLFWILKHGIKLAGMPAFGRTYDDRTLWGAVAFVRRLPSLSNADYRAITASAKNTEK
jgi:mono/diheme cytochrome c family protein